MVGDWVGLQPYKEPRSFPYVKNGAFQHYAAGHSGSLQWSWFPNNYTQPNGPDPGFFYFQKQTAYLWAILCALAVPDIGKVPAPSMHFSGLAHPPLVPP